MQTGGKASVRRSRLLTAILMTTSQVTMISQCLHSCPGFRLDAFLDIENDDYVLRAWNRTMAGSPVRRRPQTIKQAKKAYQKAGGVKKLSERELRQIERAAELKARAERIKEREAKRKLNQQKKEERLEKDRQARAKVGIPQEPTGGLGKIRASQCRLSSQWFSRKPGHVGDGGVKTFEWEEIKGNPYTISAGSDKFDLEDEDTPPTSAQEQGLYKPVLESRTSEEPTVEVKLKREDDTRVPLSNISPNRHSARNPIDDQRLKPRISVFASEAKLYRTGQLECNYQKRSQSISTKSKPQFSQSDNAPRKIENSKLSAQGTPSKPSPRISDTPTFRLDDPSMMPPPRFPTTCVHKPELILDDLDYAFPSDTQAERELSPQMIEGGSPSSPAPHDTEKARKSPPATGFDEQAQTGCRNSSRQDEPFFVPLDLQGHDSSQAIIDFLQIATQDLEDDMDENVGSEPQPTCFADEFARQANASSTSDSIRNAQDTKATRASCVNDSFSSDYSNFGSQEMRELENLVPTVCRSSAI